MLQSLNNKKAYLFLAIIIAIAGLIFAVFKIRENQKPENQIAIYEALVNIVDEKTTDPVEDARSSLKKGDVIAIFPEGHGWSDTEKNSYLIVKLKIKEKEMKDLTMAKTQKVEAKKSELGQENEKMERMEEKTILARQYKLNLPEFDTKKFWSSHEQPFKDQIFGNEIIEEK
ncbi:MAG TPA: hypothetical protein PLB52_04165 [Candidatus Moranbacteria bacterium]|nr:hypothetical protein [Candidatus Moranbacteria bacterium]